MSQLYDEATERLKDYSHWSPQANADLIRRLAERNRELEQSQVFAARLRDWLIQNPGNKDVPDLVWVPFSESFD